MLACGLYTAALPDHPPPLWCFQGNLEQLGAWRLDDLENTKEEFKDKEQGQQTNVLALLFFKTNSKLKCFYIQFI